MIFLFDLDDTILDDSKTKAYYLPKLYHQYEKYIKYGFDDFSRIWINAIGKYYALYTKGELTFDEQREMRVKEAFGSDLPDRQFIKRVLNRFDEYFKESWTLFAGIPMLLAALENYKTGIITNGSSQQQNEKIDKLGIRHFFDLIVISEEVGMRKPSGNIFEFACHELECRPEECYFIGDSYKFDVLGSLSAGMRPVWFNRYHKKEGFSDDRIVEIKCLSEIQSLLM